MNTQELIERLEEVERLGNRIEESDVSKEEIRIAAILRLAGSINHLAEVAADPEVRRDFLETVAEVYKDQGGERRT